jgi:two-component system OmpR family sensor kinase
MSGPSNRMRPPGSWRPTSLFAQALALVLVSMLAAQLINLFIVFQLPATPPDIYPLSEVAQALKTGEKVKPQLGRVLLAHPSRNGEVRGMNDERMERFLAYMLARQMNVPTENVLLGMELDGRSSARQTVRVIRQAFMQSGVLRMSEARHFIVGPFRAAVRLPDGGWRVVEPEKLGLLTPWQERILLWFGASLLALAPVAYLFARRLSRPIAAFAHAAERLGHDPNAPPIRLNGPAEVKMAETAFNEMQRRLRRYVQDRTAMIGAVAHDLRTPLTRLRFRADALDEPARSKINTDIEQMDAMISAAMAFARDASQPAQRHRLELTSLVQSIVDEMADTGADVEAAPSPPVIIEGDPVALRRLVTNLMDNAVKFGGKARARVYTEGGVAVIEVDDEGPGVQEADRERVFEPFIRVEPSRNRETGGAGLGLAVVRSVARAHGGDASLENRPGGGLRASARLPL